MNNRDDNKFEGHEESEYHFSDEDVSYEIEPESPTKPSSSTDKIKSSATELVKSKRIWVIVAIFLVLVFIIYRFISPTAAPSLEIAATSQTPNVNVTTTTTTPLTTITPTQAVQSNVTPPAVAVTGTPAPTATNATPNNVMPVTNAESTTTKTIVMPDQAISQMQADYTQKINDLTQQNKALQDQVQTLSVRVAGLEAQLNQLLKVLSQQNQTMTNNLTRVDTSPKPIVRPIPAPKIAFDVQAIIPGRAWLKSDNGDTITVAEGDVIKGVGRVTKIDPYDGVVEINTGSKVVSLSYGNGS